MVKNVNITSFDEYWPFFQQEARERGYNQTQFMAICGLPKTRYNAFTKNEINLTAYYVYKFMEGLRMTADYIEKKSGRVLSEAQRKALRKVAWSNANDDIIAALMEDKALTKKVRSQIGKKNK